MIATVGVVVAIDVPMSAAQSAQPRAVEQQPGQRAPPLRNHLGGMRGREVAGDSGGPGADPIRLAPIAGMLLGQARVCLRVSQAVKEYIVEQGFDPMLGARPLRRAIQRLLEDRLAEEFLNDKFHDGDTIRVDLEKSSIVFAKANKKDESA